MAGQTPDPRRRIVAGAADMMRRRGVHAMSVRDLARHAQAPLGSTYHYFPGGKEQLATEAVQYAGDVVARILRRELAAGPVAGVRAFLALWRDVVTGSDFRAGCPVLAVSVEEDGEGDPTPPVGAAAEVFATWRSLLAESLAAHGVERGAAGQLATLVVAASEGAVVLCRATRSATPLDDVAAQLDTLLSAAVPSGS
jgi:AcrR family transcriptional regulator